jgi:hypothetical protein
MLKPGIFCWNMAMARLASLLNRRWYPVTEEMSSLVRIGEARKRHTAVN